MFGDIGASHISYLQKKEINLSLLRFHINFDICALTLKQGILREEREFHNTEGLAMT